MYLAYSTTFLTFSIGFALIYCGVGVFYLVRASCIVQRILLFFLLFFLYTNTGENIWC